MSDTNPTPQTLALTHEFSSALLSTDISTLNGVKDFKASPKDFMMKYFNFDPFVTDDLSIVENDAKTLNICLPYYSGLEERRAQALADDDAETVIGGEIFISTIVIAGIGLGVGLGATAIHNHINRETVQEADSELTALQNEATALQGQAAALWGEQRSLFLEVHGNNAVVNPLAGGRFL